jgi:hypothetical protein
MDAAKTTSRMATTKPEVTIGITLSGRRPPALDFGVAPGLLGVVMVYSLSL